MTLVSVIIPVYNRQETIGRAINSVLSQTFQDFEIVVVDDGSTDDTIKIVEDFDDDRINLIKHGSNKGQNPARNTGLHEASGEYISYLDSDDILLEEHIELVVNKLEELPKLYAAIVTGYEDVAGNESIIYETYDGEITLEDLTKNMYYKIGGLSTITFRSNIIESIGHHDESIINSTDLDFYLEILSSYKMFGINKTLCRRFKTENSVSMDPDLVINGEEVILEKHGHKLTKKNRAERRFERVIAFAETNQLPKARSELIKCIFLHPFSPIYYYHFLISCFGQYIFNSLALYPHIRQWHPKSNEQNKVK